MPYLIRPALESSPAMRRFEDTAHLRRESNAVKAFPYHQNDKPQVQANRPPASFFTGMALTLNLVWIALFYLNVFYLIPKLLYHQKLLIYIGLQFGLFFTISFLSLLIFKLKTNNPDFRIPMPLLFNFFPFLFSQALSLAYKLIVDKIKADKVMKEKETVGLQTELSFLRSQISPHFIFNVLNNLVSLARKQSDLLEPSLLRLSGLMRYMLYESDETRVLLSKEIEYLQSYIELQKLRFGNDININTEFDLADTHHFIEPMLLIPFVENAFKHCSAQSGKPSIDIMLKSQQGVLMLQVKNNFDGISSSQTDHTSGIGLANVKRRLNLLYGNQHSLLMSSSNGMFIISLQITFQ